MAGFARATLWCSLWLHPSPACTCHSRPMGKRLLYCCNWHASFALFRHYSWLFSAASAACLYLLVNSIDQQGLSLLTAAVAAEMTATLAFNTALKRDSSLPCAAAAMKDPPDESAAPGVTSSAKHGDLIQQLLVSHASLLTQALVACAACAAPRARPSGELKDSPKHRAELPMQTAPGHSGGLSQAPHWPVATPAVEASAAASPLGLRAGSDTCRIRMYTTDRTGSVMRPAGPRPRKRFAALARRISGYAASSSRACPRPCVGLSPR